jgi:hypothetical protein
MSRLCIDIHYNFTQLDTEFSIFEISIKVLSLTWDKNIED